MKKVVAADKKMIPFCFPKFIDNFQFFYNSFGTYGNIYPKDGKYIDGFNTPQAKEALLYIKKLYDDPIITLEKVRNQHYLCICYPTNKIKLLLVSFFSATTLFASALAMM